MRWLPLLLLVGCAAGPEPLDLPEDPAEAGVPVGVRTFDESFLTAEVWYPASDREAGEPGVLDMRPHIPQSFLDALTEPLVWPEIPLTAVRDAEPRRTDEPYPVVFFSHGLSGFREYSLDYAEHLASRGYVVVSIDHPGRTITDFLPCLFSPAVDGCNLGGIVDDASVSQIITALGWLEQQADGWLAGVADLERMGMSGHSMGGGTTRGIAEVDDRFDALLILASTGAADVDTPQLVMEATCDAFDGASAADVPAQAADATGWQLLGAGHMSFTDLCALDLQGLYDTHLAGRDDLNGTLVDQLLSLGVSGCDDAAPPAGFADCSDGYLPTELSHRLIRHQATRWWDQQLYGVGPGVEDGLDPASVVHR